MMDGNGSLDAIVLRVKELVADLADVEPAEIAEDTPVFDTEGGDDGCALDSLDGLKLALALADEYGLDDDPGIDYQHLQTVREIAGYIHKLKHGGAT